MVQAVQREINPPAGSRRSYSRVRRSSPSALHLVLGLVVAGLAAVDTIVLPVFGEPHAVVGLTESTILVTEAALLSLIADRAFEFFPDRSEERRVGKECRSRWSP